ncbi:MAG: hypothetical protein WA611_14710, partial [Candidatus Acidiferrales bacterium]
PPPPPRRHLDAIVPALHLCYNSCMTFMTMTYELQAPLRQDQLRALAFFANTYGLQKFRLDEKKNWLHFDYDASRLKETEVEHVLRMARIPVVGRVHTN